MHGCDKCHPNRRTPAARRAIVSHCAVAAAALLTSSTSFAVTVDGTLDSDYGTPRIIQAINTGFGDSTVGDGTSAGGSELDAGYGLIQNGSLPLSIVEWILLDDRSSLDQALK